MKYYALIKQGWEEKVITLDYGDGGRRTKRDITKMLNLDGKHVIKIMTEKEMAQFEKIMEEGLLNV